MGNRTTMNTLSRGKLPCLIAIFSVLFGQVFSFSDPWGDNLRPKLYVDYLSQYSALVDKFLGNQTHKDYFKLLTSDGSSLLIGARNEVFNLTLPYLTENTDQRITWFPSNKDRELCLLKGKSEDDCQNYIRVLARTHDDRLLVCGTNAFNPKCRLYSHNSTHTNVDREFSGKGFCPYDPRHNSTALYTNGDLYSGTVSDFSATDALIIKDQLRTEQYDFKQLNNPNFVNSLEDDDHVYFFFRESAVEHMNCGKKIFSRVARVCKNDKGGPHKFNNKWTSFLKSRLNCSVPGEFPFYFDEIQSTTGFVDMRYSSKVDKVFYGVFTTPDNSIAGSAICSFKMSDVVAAFEDGPFKNQESANSNWLPTSRSQIPEPRPGMCTNNSFELSESSLNFIQRHSLMDWSVPSSESEPLFVKTGLGERLTVIAVDPSVRSVDGRLFDILFVGTTHGRVLKFAKSLSDKANNKDRTLIESLQVFPFHVPVRNLLVVHPDGEASKLIVLSDHEVNSVPLHRCQSLSIHTCQDCVSIQDPYCAWNLQKGTCLAHGESRVDFSTLLQNLEQGFHTGCPATTTTIIEEKSTTTESLVEFFTSPPSTTENSTVTETASPVASGSTLSTTAVTSTPVVVDPTGSLGSLPSSSSGVASCSDCPCNCTTVANDLEKTTASSTTPRHLQIPTFAPFYDVITNTIDNKRRYHPQDPNYYQDDVLPSSQASSGRGPVPVYTEGTMAVAVIITAMISMGIGFLLGLFASNKSPKLRTICSNESSNSTQNRKEFFTTEIVDKTVSLKNRASAALTRAGTRCSNHFGRIYDHRRNPFSAGSPGSDQSGSHRTGSTASTGSPPPSPSSGLGNPTTLDNFDSGYTTPSNVTTGSVTTQDTSMSTPTQSPSPASTSTSTGSDPFMSKSVNLLANVPPKSETIKIGRPLVTLPPPDITYATIGSRLPLHQQHQPTRQPYVHLTTLPRRNSSSGERQQQKVSLVKATTSNPEGTLQKVKRVYI